MGNKLSVLLCAVALCAAAHNCVGAPAPPVEVPSVSTFPPGGALAPLKQDLDLQRAGLMERYQKWKSRADAFNQTYAGHDFDADSKEAKDGAAEQAWLSSEGRDYEHLAGKFKATVGKWSELLRLGAESETIRIKAERGRPPGTESDIPAAVDPVDP